MFQPHVFFFNCLFFPSNVDILSLSEVFWGANRFIPPFFPGKGGKNPFFYFLTPNFLPRAHREEKRNLARCARRIRYNFVRVQRGFLSVQKLLHFDIYVFLVNFFFVVVCTLFFCV